MRCLQLNVGGSFHVKIDEIVQYAESSHIDIIIISETFHSLCDVIDIDGWLWHGKPRVGRAGGGVGILYRRGLVTPVRHSYF